MHPAALFFKSLFDEIVTVSWPLFKLMVPIIVLVKVLEELGGIAIFGQWLGPLMALVGLPQEMGLVWAATIATNIYGGMIVLYSLLVGCSPIWLLPLVGCFLWQQVLLVAEAASAFRARRRTWLRSHAWPQTTCTGLHPVHYATI